MKHAHSTDGLLITCIFASSVLFVSCGGGSQQSTGGNNPPPARATVYYLDCSLQTGGNGTQNSPWNSLRNVNTFAFQAGDTLLLKRGMTCSGSLVPTGSGANRNPIIVDAYGSGARPILDGGMNEETVKLVDREYWELNNLEIAGGDLCGIYVAMSRFESGVLL